MTTKPEPGTTAVDHTALRVLSLDECLSRLGRTAVGRLAFLLDGEIAVLPVNHTLRLVDRNDDPRRHVTGALHLVHGQPGVIPDGRQRNSAFGHAGTDGTDDDQAGGPPSGLRA